MSSSVEASVTTTTVTRVNQDAVSLALSEVGRDIRSNETVVQVSIANNTGSNLRLSSIDQYSPAGVRQAHLQRASFVATEERYRSLILDLNTLINDEYTFRSAEIMEARKRVFRAWIDDVFFGGANASPARRSWAILRTVLKPLTGALVDRRLDRSYQATKIQIHSYADARHFVDLLGEDTAPSSAPSSAPPSSAPPPSAPPPSAPPSSTTLSPMPSSPAPTDARRAQIQGKLTQLQQLDALRQEAPLRIKIEPGTVHNELYPLTFPRAALNARRYGVSIEVRLLADQPPNEEIVKRASLSVNITAQPWALSLVGMIFAVLGSACRSALSNGTSWDALLTTLLTPPLLASVLLALLVANVYEVLQIKSIERLPPSWRSAALIGFACGMFADNVIAAMKAAWGGGAAS